MEDLNKNTQEEQSEIPEKLNVSNINHSILNRDLSKEICFFRAQKDAIVDQAVVLFKDKLNDDDLLLLKKSFELNNLISL